MQVACGVVFIQILERPRIKKFGEKAISAMLKELKQLNEGAVPGEKA